MEREYLVVNFHVICYVFTGLTVTVSEQGALALPVNTDSVKSQQLLHPSLQMTQRQTVQNSQQKTTQEESTLPGLLYLCMYSKYTLILLFKPQFAKIDHITRNKIDMWQKVGDEYIFNKS